MKILTKWLRSYVPGISVDDHQLAADLTLRGIAVEGVHVLGAGAGHLFEMDITTNRVDAMNHYGVAREAATIYGLPLAPLEGNVVPAAAAAALPVAVEDSAKELCGRFTGRVVREVRIAPSVGRVAEYFGLLGLKQISNAVDASNFVLHGMGHPTHAFDLDTIDGGIVVRLARPGERLRLLDGSEITLAADDLVIADRKKPLSLAGVMGGWESMITPATRNILVESAWFDPATIRRSARRHGLHTDASHRFERGADFNAAPLANDLVAELILASGGHAEGELIDVTTPEVRERTANRPPIRLSPANVQRLLGATVEDAAGESALTAELIARYLTALGCRFDPAAVSAASADESLPVRLPSWRLDLEREIDLIEEVARVFGYNRFRNTLPAPLAVVEHPLARPEQEVRTRLLALGWTETISTTFASERDAAVFAGLRAGPPVALENPLSEEARLLRPSLLPAMVTMLAHNLNRDVPEVRLFEVGATFSAAEDTVIERERLAVGLTGEIAGSALHAAKDAGFYELKGAVESLMGLFDAAGSPGTAAVERVRWTDETPEWVQPGRGASVVLGERVIAQLGELAHAQRDARKLRQPVWLAEVDLAALYELRLRTPTAREPSRFQTVERDFSFVFSDATVWSAVADALRGLDIGELVRVAPAEIFRHANGSAVPHGHYALLVRCTFQSAERTLREEEIAAWSSAVAAALTQLGGVQRAG
ncbi:MAG: phenylalanine--tRNA ligase subunit beta [Acidobacteriota bacterium]|nr:phenylalanine--tRNA ligase subunit beta [Acidobacteriota bacterium]